MAKQSTSELLSVWERALPQHPVERGVTLLSLVWPQRSTAELAGLTIGSRNSALLTLREELFGVRFNAVAACSRCSEQLEIHFLVDDIRAPAPDDPTPLLQVQSDGYLVQFRPPNSSDLLAIAGGHDLSSARHHLLRRCLTHFEWRVPEDALTESDTLPIGIEEQVLAQMVQADPQGDIQLALACAACGQEWLVTFDIAGYLWHELDSWAQRLLRDVHHIASAYGWGEAEILALSSSRRAFYLAQLDI